MREELAQALLEAMSLGDGDAVARLADPRIALAIGPHEIDGVAKVRMMAEQETELVMDIEPADVRTTDGGVVVDAVRRQRWRASGEIAHEDMVRIVVAFTADDTIERARLERLR